MEDNKTTKGLSGDLTSATADNEIIENLEVLMNLDALEQADSWDELLNLTAIENLSKGADEKQDEEGDN